MGIITFEKVTKRYPNGTTGVEDISLDIDEGEFVFITGRSGSGKSTLLKLMCGQHQPTAGKVTVNGADLSKLGKKQRPRFYRNIGIMQPEYGLLENRSLLENVAFPMWAAAMPAGKSKKRALQMLGSMGVAKRADRLPHEVSMGEAARAMLARAMILNPKILFADEPTANLDQEAGYDIMRLFEELNYLGLTIVVSSHNRELVSIMKKRVVTLSLGRLAADEKNAVYNTKAAGAVEERRLIYERTAGNT